PERLSREDDVSGFDSGEPLLDDWLRLRALQNEASGASRTYVVCTGKKVMGYYTLAAGVIAGAGKAKHAGPSARYGARPPCCGQDPTAGGIGVGLRRDAILR